jgi:hypothetical protein
MGFEVRDSRFGKAGRVSAPAYPRPGHILLSSNPESWFPTAEGLVIPNRGSTRSHP